MITWITGNSGSGKTTLANRMRKHEVVLDGDAMRAVWPGLGFSKHDREEQNLRVARLAKTLEQQGFDVIVATICPYKDLRERVRAITGCRFIYLEGGREGVQYPYEK
jgi:adenylylsulfate kinase